MLIGLLFVAVDWLGLARQAGQGRAITLRVEDVRAAVADPAQHYAVATAVARADKALALGEALTPLLAGADAETRAMAAKAMTKHGVASAHFVPLLGDVDWRVRVEALRGALGDAQSLAAVKAAFAQGLTAHPLLVGLEASFPHAAAFVDVYEKLYTRADDDPDQKRAACLALFGALKAGRKVWLPDCADADWRARLMARAMEERLATFDLQALWRSPDERIRATAAAAAVPANDTAIVEAALASKDMSVLAYVADAMAQEKRPLPPRWLALAKQRLSDKLEPDTRLALQAALGQPASLPVETPRRFPRPPARVDLSVTTTRGVFTIRLDGEVAPNAVASFIALAGQRFFDNTIIHRVVSDYVVQGGDPTGTGIAGPGYVLPAETSTMPFFRGALGMADAGPGTAGSQFFIMHSRAPHLEGRYTWMGWVKSGMAVVDRLQVGDAITSIR